MIEIAVGKGSKGNENRFLSSKRGVREGFLDKRLDLQLLTPHPSTRGAAIYRPTKTCAW